MNRKYLLIAVSLAAIFVLIGGAVLLKSKKGPSLISPVGLEEQQAEEIETELITWEDPAGFSFTYPENIEIDTHEEDEENYAHLELSFSSHPGGIIIWVKDMSYTDIKDWANQEATKGGQIFDTELGGEPAKKIAYSEPVKLVTATIDVDTLVLVEMTPDGEDYWQKVHDEILSSFTFIPLEGEKATAPGPWEGEGGAGGIIEEAEEVIE